MTRLKYKIFIEEDVMREFKEYCKANAYSVSGKLELVMRKELMNFHSVKENKGFLELLSDFMKGNLKKDHANSYGNYPEEKAMEQVEQKIVEARLNNPKFVGTKKTPTIEQLRMKRGF